MTKLCTGYCMSWYKLAFKPEIAGEQDTSPSKVMFSSVDEYE